MSSLLSCQIAGIFCCVYQKDDLYHASVEDLVRGSFVEALKETQEAAHRWCFEQLLAFLLNERNKHIPRRLRTQLNKNNLDLAPFLLLMNSP